MLAGERALSLAAELVRERKRGRHGAPSPPKPTYDAAAGGADVVDAVELALDALGVVAKGAVEDLVHLRACTCARVCVRVSRVRACRRVRVRRVRVRGRARTCRRARVRVLARGAMERWRSRACDALARACAPAGAGACRTRAQQPRTLSCFFFGGGLDDLRLPMAAAGLDRRRKGGGEVPRARCDAHACTYTHTTHAHRQHTRTHTHTRHARARARTQARAQARALSPSARRRPRGQNPKCFGFCVEMN